MRSLIKRPKNWSSLTNALLTKDIYTDPELYDRAHWWKINDLDFITAYADEIGGPILELGAGTGRLSRPILKNGHTYTGIDSSPAFVQYAQEKFSGFAAKATFLTGDMRDFSLDRTYQFIFIGFNSIFHLLSEKEVRSCFQCVYNHLHADGSFIIDAFIPDPLFLYRDKQKYYVMEFDYPDGSHCIVSETNDYDEQTQINHIKWFFNVANREIEEFSFDMQMIFPDSMDRLLTKSGFVVKNKYGNYDRTPLSQESQLQIYVCGK